MASFNEDYRKRLSELTNKTQAEIERLYWEAAEKSYVYDKELFTALNKPWIPLEQNAFLQNLVPAMIQHTQGLMRNLTQTTALKTLSPYGKFVPLPDAFMQHLDFAEMKVSTGVQDYNSAIKDAVRTLSDGGMRMIRYEGENKRPVNRRVETVARMTVLTGITQLAAEVTWHNIEQLQAEHVIVSQHIGARTGEGFKGHINFQGRVFSLNGFKPEKSDL